jgi:hypothetical protein
MLKWYEISGAGDKTPFKLQEEFPFSLSRCRLATRPRRRGIIWKFIFVFGALKKKSLFQFVAAFPASLRSRLPQKRSDSAVKHKKQKNKLFRSCLAVIFYCLHFPFQSQPNASERL